MHIKDSYKTCGCTTSATVRLYFLAPQNSHFSTDLGLAKETSSDLERAVLAAAYYKP